MASITINEISATISYVIGNNSYACVAFPITACWGPALDLANISEDDSIDDILDGVTWERFPSTQAGIESFVSTYRGPSSIYRLAKDYSYQMALTLMSAGYDVLVCRMCPGAKAQAVVSINQKDYAITAKYPGTFGNELMVRIRPNEAKHYVNIIVYVVDSSGIKTSVENITCTFEEEYATDSILYIDEVESNFIDFTLMTTTNAEEVESIMLEGGTDTDYLGDDVSVDDYMEKAIDYAKQRYLLAGYVSSDLDTVDFLVEFQNLADTKITTTNKIVDEMVASTLYYREQIFYFAMYAYDLLQDKLAYSHNRLITPGWDDQDFLFLIGETVSRIQDISPFHIKLMESAYLSRCATAYLDIPRSLARSGVYNDDENDNKAGYAQLLARYNPSDTSYDVNGTLFNTHSALFAPWGQYKYTSTTKMNMCPPSFMAMMIQRAMIKNQSIQYEWALPRNRKHTLNLGKLDYHINKKLLDEWQTTEGVGVNCITDISDLGTSLWGNSTVFEVAPATYQALANLSTRLLVNAIEDLVWRVGVSITFKYNNRDAYSDFYAGVTPLLDTMLDVGAIDGYRVEMAADLDEIGQVMANSVVGKIYLVIFGVINDITVDLVALPPGTDLSEYE